jgi:hypothetical protein
MYDMSMDISELERFLDEALSRLHALCPFSPATVVDSPIFLRISGFCQGSVHNGSSDTCTATADYGLGWVDA